MPDEPDISTQGLRRQVREIAARWREEGRYTPRSDSWLRGFDLEFSRELSRNGLVGMTWPREYGGGEHSQSARLAVVEELLRAGAPVAAHWMGDRQVGPAILRHGSDEVKDELLKEIVSSSAIFCLGMSEPEAGSDLAAVRTTATAVPGGWRLRGHKIWTSHAHRATHAYVLARTRPEADRHAGLSEFIVDIGENVRVTPIIDLTGEHHFNEVNFDDVFVPAHRLLGEEGNGWRQVTEQLSLERGGPERALSSYAALRALIDLADRVPERDRRDIGVLAARLGVLREISRQIARAVDSGEVTGRLAATSKYLGNQFEVDVIETLRTVGAATPDVASVFGDALLASPAFGIRGGASDVLLSIVAKQEVAP